MKKLIFVLPLMALAGCGYSSINNELTGQVKKVVHHTPIICPDYVTADISLGVMRNGVGSMSNQDLWVNVVDKDSESLLKKAAESGQLVKVAYNTKRFVFCPETDHYAAGVELLK